MRKDKPKIETSPLTHASDEMEFDQPDEENKGEEESKGPHYIEEESKEDQNLLDSSGDTSNNSVKIIEFDEAGNVSPRKK